MSTYLFIWTIMAGSLTSGSPSASPVWKAQWTNAGVFDSPVACQRAAANLGLNMQEYRCLSKKEGEVQ